MHIGQYIFAQLTAFLPQRQFRRIAKKYMDQTFNWNPSPWSHLLALMYGQLAGCGSLRELTDILAAHAKRSYSLGFGARPINRTSLSRVNSYRDYHIFEDFAFYMINIAQGKRITKDFELHGRFYAVDSTTIDLCMSMFNWAHFRSTKSGIKVHTQIDIATEIPVFTGLRTLNFMIPISWICLHTNLQRVMSLIEATLTSPECSPSLKLVHSSSSEKRANQPTR